MKLATLVLVITALVQMVAGQEPPLPSSTATPTPNPSARPELNIPDIPMEVEPPPLVPNTTPTPKKNLPTITELDSAFQKSSLGQAAEEQRLHLEWRKLKTRTVQEPDLMAAKRTAEAARTQEEKRNLRRAYYKMLYTRMQALADTPELKNYLEGQKQGILNGLAEPHLRPDPTPKPGKTP